MYTGGVRFRRKCGRLLGESLREAWWKSQTLIHTIIFSYADGMLRGISPRQGRMRSNTSYLSLQYFLAGQWLTNVSTLKRIARNWSNRKQTTKCSGNLRNFQFTTLSYRNPTGRSHWSTFWLLVTLCTIIWSERRNSRKLQFTVPTC